MSKLDDRALEAARKAHNSQMGVLGGKPVEAAVTAYQAAMPPPVSPELLREALEALQLIANATHPRFLAEHDIHLLHVSEKTFDDCINIARAAADKIRAALEHQP
jgi:hypothetical protein